MEIFAYLYFLKNIVFYTIQRYLLIFISSNNIVFYTIQRYLLIFISSINIVFYTIQRYLLIFISSKIECSIKYGDISLFLSPQIIKCSSIQYNMEIFTYFYLLKNRVLFYIYCMEIFTYLYLLHESLCQDGLTTSCPPWNILW